MSPLAPVGYMLQLLAAGLARRVAVPRPAHRPIARYLAAIAIADPLRAILAWLVLDPAQKALGDGVPYSGLTRAVYHLDQALLLGQPLGLAVVAALVFEARPPLLHLAGMGALLETALTLAYPTEPGPAYAAWTDRWAWVIAAVHGVEQAVCWGAAARWLQRRPGAWPDESGKMVLALAAADLALYLQLAAEHALPKGTFTAWRLGDGARVAILLWVCWLQWAWWRSTKAPTAAAR